MVKSYPTGCTRSSKITFLLTSKIMPLTIVQKLAIEYSNYASWRRTISLFQERLHPFRHVISLNTIIKKGGIFFFLHNMIKFPFHDNIILTKLKNFVTTILINKFHARTRIIKQFSNLLLWFKIKFFIIVNNSFTFTRTLSTIISSLPKYIEAKEITKSK